MEGRMTSDTPVVLFPATSPIVESTSGTEAGTESGTMPPRESTTDTLDSTMAEGIESPGSTASDSTAISDCELSTCELGDIETQTVPCGDCGTQQVGRVCDSDCTWQEWVPLTTCKDQGCHPGSTMAMDGASCACGGVQVLTATCNEACSFDAYVESAPCPLDCCATIIYCNTMQASDPDVRNQYPGRGTWCEQSSASCSHAEALAGCNAKVAAICESGMVEAFHMDYL